MTEKDELLQAKDRELAEAQKELKQKVSFISCRDYTCVDMHTTFPPGVGYRKLS